MDISYLFLILIFYIFDHSVGQDLQFECFSCADKFDKCELDCSFTLQASNITKVSECHDDCLASKTACVDDTSTLKCTACMLLCAETYDTEMRACLSKVGRTSKMTYGSSLSECEIYASFDMDECMSKCSTQNGLSSQDDDWTD